MVDKNSIRLGSSIFYPMLKISVDYKNTVGVNFTLFSYRMYRVYTLYYYKYPLLV